MMKKIVFVIVLFLFSCALFRKKERTTDIATQSSINKLESSQLVLKSVGKETQIFTYWNDSGFYQYQHIKEQIDQAKLDQLSTTTQHDAKHSINTKKVEPVAIWIYGLILPVLGCCYLIIKRVFY